jgi:hypothetical protein
MLIPPSFITQPPRARPSSVSSLYRCNYEAHFSRHSSNSLVHNASISFAGAIASIVVVVVVGIVFIVSS